MLTAKTLIRLGGLPVAQIDLSLCWMHNGLAPFKLLSCVGAS